MSAHAAQPITAQTGPDGHISVMLVDDSIVVRSIVERIIESDAGLHIVASVATAPEALAILERERVDVILLDLEMPGMHGLEALPLLLAKQSDTRIIILSANCEDGGTAAVEALSLGAADTLLKPGRGTFAGRFGVTLIERIRALSERGPVGAISEEKAPLRHCSVPDSVPSRSIGAVGIGASTGGIMAINQFLASLPRWFEAPLFITQHLPAGFISYFAEQLQRANERAIRVAADGMAVEAGHVYVAPGDGHLRVVGTTTGTRIIIDRAAMPSGATPSVDPMLASLADAYGPQLCGVMLSGMGRDGLEGARRLCAHGGIMLAQTMSSSVVWGMPGAVVREGLAQGQGDPAELARLIGRIVRGLHR